MPTRKKNAAPNGAAFCLLFSVNCFPLLHRVLERFRRAELRRASGCDMDCLPRARIPALARRARLRGEDTEAGNRYFVASFKAGNDAVDHRLDGALRIRFRGAENAVHLVYDVCLIHGYSANLLIPRPKGSGYAESIGNTP